MIHRYLYVVRILISRLLQMKETGNTYQVFVLEIGAYLKSIHMQTSAGLQVFTRPFPRIKLTPTSTKEIIEIVKSLKSKNSHGYYEIPIKILKLSLPFIASPLIYICNKSLLKGRFSNMAKIFPNNPTMEKRKKNQQYQIIDQYPYSHPFLKYLRR